MPQPIDGIDVRSRFAIGAKISINNLMHHREIWAWGIWKEKMLFQRSSASGEHPRRPVLV